MALKARDRVSRAELERRHREVAEKLQEHGLDALLVSGINFAATLGYLRYLTNWAQPFVGEYYLLGKSGEGIFLARTQERATLVREASRLISRAGATARDVAQEMRKIGARKVGVCSLETMTAAFYQDLKKETGNIELRDATAIMDQARMVKSPEELNWVRKSSELCDAALARFTELAAPGANEHEVFAELDYLVRKRGAENTYFMMASDPAPVPKFLDMAADSYDSGDVILFNAEIAGPGGYYTQLVRSGFVGKPRGEVRDVFAVCLEALEAGETALKPGVTASQLFRAMDAVIGKSKYRRGLHVGHAQGLDIFEKPLVSDNDDTVMRPGMIMVFHPHVELPSGGGLWVGESFLVTEQGNSRLNRSSRELFEV